MEQSLPLPHRPEIPEDAELASADERAWRELLARLSRQSVTKHFAAYEDVSWDDPDYAVDASDPRFELIELDPLGGTDWYRSLPQQKRAQIGLHRFAAFMAHIQTVRAVDHDALNITHVLIGMHDTFRNYDGFGIVSAHD
jgi:hypothetical protein